MTSADAGDFETVLGAAVLLHENGQSTDMTLIAVRRLSRGLGMTAVAIPSWTSMTLATEEPTRLRVVPVAPVTVNMRRVSAAMRAIDRAEDGTLDRPLLRRELADAAQESGSATPPFVIACALGAAALSIVFGVNDYRAIVLVAASAAVGGGCRRLLARWHLGAFVQAFTAALVAGLGGALAPHLGLGGVIGLTAVCPAMVLVPGPQILNGAMDLLSARISLGLSRLGYAAVIFAAIAAGLILGLFVGGQTLPLSSTEVHVPIYADVLAAGVAAAAYPVYFSMPYRMIGLPVAAGMIAHAVHWFAVDVWHAGLPGAALVSCLVVGAALAPVSHLLRIPFAGIGFAAVVALVPGMYVFRVLAGLMRLTTDTSPSVVAATVSNGSIAVFVVAAMAVGLAVPNHIRNAVVAARES